MGRGGSPRNGIPPVVVYARFVRPLVSHESLDYRCATVACSPREWRTPPVVRQESLGRLSEAKRGGCFAGGKVLGLM